MNKCSGGNNHINIGARGGGGGGGGFRRSKGVHRGCYQVDGIQATMGGGGGGGLQGEKGGGGGFRGFWGEQ